MRRTPILSACSAVLLLAAGCADSAPNPTETGAFTLQMSHHAVPAAPVTIGDDPGEVQFQFPESALHDPEQDVVLVSNLGAGPVGPTLGTENDGVIMKLAPDGSPIDLAWAAGSAEHPLVSPTGMALQGDLLWVVDRGGLVAFDRRTGEWRASVPIAGASFLNDVCEGPRGELYVTDTGLDGSLAPNGADAIFRIDEGRVSVFAAGTHLNNPNGCTTLGANVVVTTFSEAGELFRVNPSGKRFVIGTMPENAGSDDSVVRVDGSWYVSSWEAAGVFRMPLGGGEAVRVLDLAFPADMGYDARRGNLLVPSLFGNVLVIDPLG